jgi:hypothetical protein
MLVRHCHAQEEVHVTHVFKTRIIFAGRGEFGAVRIGVGCCAGSVQVCSILFVVMLLHSPWPLLKMQPTTTPYCATADHVTRCQHVSTVSLFAR